MRILVVDKLHFNRLKIEKLFNYLGYYRVAPVQNLEELMTLLAVAGPPFDLVVVNVSLAPEALDLPALLLENTQVLNALIYAGKRESLRIAFNPLQKMRMSQLELPDLQCIQQIISFIDPSARHSESDHPQWIYTTPTPQYCIVVNQVDGTSLCAKNNVVNTASCSTPKPWQ